MAGIPGVSLHRRNQGTALLASLVAVALLIGCIAPLQRSPVYRVTPQGGGNQIEAVAVEGGTQFDIHSEHGIGRADIELIEGKWPAKIVFRLHLAGLEHFSIVCEHVSVNVSVGSSGNDVRQWLIVGETEEAIDPDHPAWMEVRIVPGEGTTETIPLKDGLFEMIAPTSGFVDACSSRLSIEWVDFYR